MTSLAVSSSGSPITRLPYDTLHEIFTHCLPRYPLHVRQPNTMTPQMRLCHICSSWRTLALASPTLWTHLSYCFTIVQEYKRPNSALEILKFEFMERDIEFIQWWKKNHGQLAPYLSFYLKKSRSTDVAQKLTASSIAFFLEYLTSAQYLKLDIFFWSWIHDKLKAGYPVAFPNLHAVQVENTLSGRDTFYQLQNLLSAHAFTALRCLSLGDIIPSNGFAIPQYWSTLTYVSMFLSISLNFWLHLIRSIPRLQWGDFDIAIGSLPLSITYHTRPPPKSTLLNLTTLSVAVRGRLEHNVVFPLSLLFTNLHLPSLRTLSLSAPGAKAYEDRCALRELYTVLGFTPTLTKLVLKDKTLDISTHTPPTILPAIRDTEPVWTYTTKLEHVQLTLPAGIPKSEPQLKEFLALLVGHIYSSANVWLDLQNPACPIRAVTITNNRFHHITEPMMASVRSNARKAPKVALEIISEMTDQVAMDMRKEWGSRI